MPSAWMTPRGRVIPIRGEHELEIHRIADLEASDAIYLGWIRMIRSAEGGPGLIDGMPEYIERNKESALQWLRWPEVITVDAEQDDGRIVSFVTSSDELRDQSVHHLLFRVQMQHQHVEHVEPPTVLPPQQSIEGYYPSGRPIRYGDRRPVKVRSHLRRRVVQHLEHPPPYCLCNRSKAVDSVRRGMIRRIR
jgi:hypothetical protein